MGERSTSTPPGAALRGQRSADPVQHGFSSAHNNTRGEVCAAKLKSLTTQIDAAHRQQHRQQQQLPSLHPGLINRSGGRIPPLARKARGGGPPSPPEDPLHS
ncbi:unnamed protein product [Lampetra planeri]